MIPVTLQAEPADFDIEVRQKGLVWLAAEGISSHAVLSKSVKLPNYWSHSNKQLWDAYSGVCAYLAIFFEWGTGASSTDHFVAKSRHPGDVYEWGNYRLSCLGANRNKNKFDDVLDPMGLPPNTFVINFASGKIYPNPSLTTTEKSAAQKTICRLKLDSPENNLMRARHFSDYINGDVSLNYLSRHSPFVHAEILRQGLL